MGIFLQGGFGGITPEGFSNIQHALCLQFDILVTATLTARLLAHQ